ncbi:unnamed protein product [Victoria cruziana]
MISDPDFIYISRSRISPKVLRNRAQGESGSQIRATKSENLSCPWRLLRRSTVAVHLSAETPVRLSAKTPASIRPISAIEGRC